MSDDEGQWVGSVLLYRAGGGLYAGTDRDVIELLHTASVTRPSDGTAEHPPSRPPEGGAAARPTGRGTASRRHVARFARSSDWVALARQLQPATPTERCSQQAATKEHHEQGQAVGCF